MTNGPYRPPRLGIEVLPAFFWGVVASFRRQAPVVKRVGLRHDLACVTCLSQKPYYPRVTWAHNSCAPPWLCSGQQGATPCKSHMLTPSPLMSAHLSRLIHVHRTGNDLSWVGPTRSKHSGASPLTILHSHTYPHRRSRGRLLLVVWGPSYSSSWLVSSCCLPPPARTAPLSTCTNIHTLRSSPSHNQLEHSPL